MCPYTNIHFIKNPNLTKFQDSLPNIVKEVLGVLHSKILLFDNNVILTGANLSESYFTNRTDRYWVFQQHEPFADFCEDYINSLCNNSAKLNYDMNLKDSSHTDSNKVVFKQVSQHNFKWLRYDHRVKINKNEDIKLKEYFNDLGKYNNNYITRLSEENLLSLKADKNFVEKLANELNSNDGIKLFDYIKSKYSNNSENNKEMKNESEHEKENENIENSHNSSNQENTNDSQLVYVFPSFQNKGIEILDDEDLLHGLLNKIKENQSSINKVVISTGYFNPPKNLSTLLVELGLDIDIITSSPEANSFFNAKGIKKYVPYFYRSNLNKLINLNGKSKIECFEYKLSNWTFHSKGIWVYDKLTNLPKLTVIGSSNFSKFKLKIKIKKLSSKC